MQAAAEEAADATAASFTDPFSLSAILPAAAGLVARAPAGDHYASAEPAPPRLGPGVFHGPISIQVN